MDKDVALAIHDRQSMIDSGRKWARLDIQLIPEKRVLLEWGFINLNGVHEVESGIRKYYIVNNTVEHINLIHP